MVPETSTIEELEAAIQESHDDPSLPDGITCPYAVDGDDDSYQNVCRIAN
jgi:hypothetical protein